MHKIIERILFYSCLIAMCDCITINPALNDTNAIPSRILSKFVLKYLANEPVYISLIVGSSSQRIDDFVENFFNSFRAYLILPNLSFNILNHIDNSTHMNRNAFSILLIEDTKSLETILSGMEVKSFHLAQMYLIVVLDELRSTLDDIFGILWRAGLVNSLVLMQNDSKLYTLQTFLPYQKNCDKLGHLKLMSFSSSNLSHDKILSLHELYPEKIKNLNHCPLTVAVPLDGYPSGFMNERKEFEGVNVNIIKMMSKSLNFRIRYKLPQVEYGAAFTNGTLTGNFDLITRGVVDLSLGSFILTILSYSACATSHPFFRALMGFGYVDKDEYSPFTRLIAPFDKHLWIISGCVFLISVAVLSLTKQFTRKWRHFIIGGRMNRTPILNSWSIVLGGALPNRFICRGISFSNFSRSMTMLWIILWLVIRNSYQGSLYKHLQGFKHSSAYDTIAKLQKSNVKIIVQEPFFFTVERLFPLDRFIFNGTVLDSNLASLYDTEDDLISLTDKAMLDIYNMRNPQRPLTFSRDHVIGTFFVLLFRKNSPLTMPINNRLMLINEAGLVNLWRRNYSGQRRTKSTNRHPSQLKMVSVLAPFRLCIFLYLLSCIVFTLELVSHKVRCLRRVVDFLTY